MISYFDPNDTSSVEVDKIVEEGMKYFENKIRIRDWHERSVGWYRVDLSVTPELALDEDKMPD